MLTSRQVLGRALGSLGGRLVFIVSATLAATAAGTLAAASWLWSQNMEQLQRSRFVDTIGEIHDRIVRDQGAFDARLRRYDFRHYALQPHPWPVGRAEVGGLRSAIEEQFGPSSDPHVVRVTERDRCIQRLSLNLHEHLPQFGCWYVRFDDRPGHTYALEIDRDAVRNFDLPSFVPLYLAVVAAESSLLAILISRLTLVPLRRLSDASNAFARSLDPSLVPESGPREVRLALRTFNLMQQRVREGLTTRTQLLASISHDLQTPLTRMRIRLERVEDQSLRERLLADLGMVLGMVRGGLALAPSGESQEPWAVVQLDELLDTLATDAQEIGRPLTFVSGDRACARVKPGALVRALQNLCDNAVSHAGAATLRVERHGGEIRILVEDRGPGLPEDQLEAVFEPFRRGSAGREGTGLGLAIARAQAATFGARIRLENRQGGGLRAVLMIGD